ncbi:hypothetical protein MKP05_12180 [Halomonas sp. EGI 63088]|uniref:Uncharacterized protein n=1 Tax=Halomonas flagellata TaxID=2920385 RepID=A0ABS9RVM2_9GAMM|nr:hypothetical protein [Halomonas flagellata]MCH4563882.1 hypothetical protein [Halomonas flagellata]
MRHKEYWDALARLKKNEPIHLPKGAKINKQNVALEAGKANASSIRKGRDFDELIVAIEAAKKPSKQRTQNNRVNTLVDEKQKMQDMLDIAHAKYLASLHALFKAGEYTVKRPPSEVVKFPERDSAVRPVMDREKPSEPSK